MFLFDVMFGWLVLGGGLSCVWFKLFCGCRVRNDVVADWCCWVLYVCGVRGFWFVWSSWLLFGLGGMFGLICLVCFARLCGCRWLVFLVFVLQLLLVEVLLSTSSCCWVGQS